VQIHEAAANIPVGLVPIVSGLLIVVFVTVLVMVLSQKVNKAIAALLGVSLVYYILFFATGGHYDFITFAEAVNIQTLLLIVGLIISVSIIDSSGLFQFIAIKFIRLFRGNPQSIFILFCGLSLLISGVLTAVAAMLILGPLTVSVAQAIEKDPFPYLIAEGIMVNTGAFTTSIASLPNIMITVANGYSYVYVAMNFAPLAIILMVVSILYFRRIFGEQLNREKLSRKSFVMELDAWDFVPSKREFYTALLGLVMIVVGFVVFSESWAVAMSVATFLLFVTRGDAKRAFADVNWTTIFFFAALFAIVGGLEYMGILVTLGTAFAVISQGNIIIAMIVNVWMSSILSSFVDNIPITATLIPVMYIIGEVSGFTNLDPLWWSLILGVNLGGSITPIGSPSVVLALHLNEDMGQHVSLKEYVKIGATVSFLQLGLALLFLLSAWVFLGPGVTVMITYVLAAILSVYLVRQRQIHRVVRSGYAKLRARITSIKGSSDRPSDLVE
jgi:Na+/H+ antiporter NhaD/arsenite permease-like protein